MSAPAKLTEQQREQLRRFRNPATRRLGVRARNHGERVTLASLYYRGLLTRADDRGASDGSQRGYTYKPSPRVLAALDRRKS